MLGVFIGDAVSVRGAVGLENSRRFSVARLGGMVDFIGIPDGPRRFFFLDVSWERLAAARRSLLGMICGLPRERV